MSIPNSIPPEFDRSVTPALQNSIPQFLHLSSSLGTIHPRYCRLAQLVEQLTVNQRVVSSSLTAAAKF